MAAKAKDKPKAKSGTTTVSPKKARHASAWARGQARKQLLREEQEAAAARNRARRARGELTPWEQAKAAARWRKVNGAVVSDEVRARLEQARAEGRVPVVKLGRVEETEGLPVVKAESNTSSNGGGKREAIRNAKRGAR